MEIFPTQYSLLSASALKNVIEKQYGLANLSCRLLIHNVSDTYILENETDKYIFKIYRDAHRKLEEIKGEIELLNILHRRGAQVSYPLPDLEENNFQSFHAAEGLRYGVLFSFAYGEVVTDLSDAHLGTIGREMAKLHEITSSITLSHHRKEYTIETLFLEPLRTIRPAFKGLEEEYAFLEETSMQVIKRIEGLDLSSFGYGYCHYDFLPKNFHFQAEDSLTFFDFDFAGKGYLVNDLASFYAHFFLHNMHGKITQDEADRAFNVFIESYRTIRPLSDAEVDAIPYFGFAWWLFYLGFQYDNFEDWSNLFFSTRFIKDRVKWMKTWIEWYAKF